MCGPDFLLQSEDKRPKNPVIIKDKAFEELVKNPVLAIHALVNSNDLQEKPDIGQVFDCERFGELRLLLRVSARVLRAVKSFKRLRNGKSSSPLNQEKELTAEEINEAEVYWIKSVQKTASGREILYLW